MYVKTPPQRLASETQTSCVKLTETVLQTLFWQKIVTSSSWIADTLSTDPYIHYDPNYTGDTISVIDEEIFKQKYTLYYKLIQILKIKFFDDAMNERTFTLNEPIQGDYLRQPKTWERVYTIKKIENGMCIEWKRSTDWTDITYWCLREDYKTILDQLTTE